ncbi:alpha-ketoglutarate-dependent dioxygenase AlkB [Humisphaera borealis]|uniref:Alpha-ketoglutarate-dependent dioxygenase AlkB n=1 Tax=Humisphaera borealis TaxID=2807512 RepID=A0A7M2WSJ3_9BACT|nr:alpha-ketoglutarate-dependent dioxygenase AlkB [Humisphaera borealis]QOV88152.1 alpha-ketoglutarate-dependent dioxygenase AlkB [Humisphaera borealis]
MDDFVYKKAFLDEPEQIAVVETVRGLTPGFYIPRTRWGKAMSLRMNCLGRHWSARDYKYHTVRKDVDGLACAPIPDALQMLGQRAIVATRYLPQGLVRPFDSCIVNWYPEAGSKLGDHVDNSESPEAIASGYPVVSISVGASCVFRMGGLSRTDPYEQTTLESGDLVVFGRSRRLAYHGVKKIIPGTTPATLPLPEPGRINLTFRIV